MTEGQAFNNSMLNIIVNEKDYQLSYSGNINTNKSGVYDVTIIATNTEWQNSTYTIKIKVKSNTQTIDNVTKNNAKNPNKFSVNLEYNKQ